MGNARSILGLQEETSENVEHQETVSVDTPTYTYQTKRTTNSKNTTCTRMNAPRKPTKRPKTATKPKANKYTTPVKKRKTTESSDENEYSDDQEEDECTICQEGYKSVHDKSYLACAHFFHKKCIDYWLAGHNSCPVCRFDKVKK